ncbi:NUDIX hydrolase domain-like protein [Nemania sp. FL0916]|nr:NUDIX hydrolase domain-like protein [Nemania sp. FL0916]
MTANPNPLAPRVGVAAIIYNAKGELIMGKRMGSHGEGSWACPGGHLEMGESFFTCAERETLEETGLHVKGVKVAAVTNDVFDAAAKHYITVFVQCEMEDANAQPETMEPDKCEGWLWMTWDAVRLWIDHHEDTTPEWAGKKCFLPLRNLSKTDVQMLPSQSI